MDQLAQRAVALLDKTEAGKRPVRLLGAGVHNLEPTEGQEAAAGEDAARLRFDSGG
jgi:hypothetical protein